jgi:hypothetical protein
MTGRGMVCVAAPCQPSAEAAPPPFAAAATAVEGDASPPAAAPPGPPGALVKSQLRSPLKRISRSRWLEKWQVSCSRSSVDSRAERQLASKQ